MRGSISIILSSVAMTGISTRSVLTRCLARLQRVFFLLQPSACVHGTGFAMPHQRWCVTRCVSLLFCFLLSVVVKTEKERVVDKAWFRCACPPVNSKLKCLLFGVTRVVSSNFLSDSVKVTTLQCLVCWRWSGAWCWSSRWRFLSSGRKLAMLQCGEVKIFKFVYFQKTWNIFYETCTGW